MIPLGNDNNHILRFVMQIKWTLMLLLIGLAVCPANIMTADSSRTDSAHVFEIAEYYQNWGPVIPVTYQDDVYESILLDKSQLAFDDGDTIFYKNETIRMYGIDCPEIIHKQHGILENQPYGPRAAEFTQKAISQAIEVSLSPLPFRDYYDRVLGHLFLDGQSLAVMLIQHQLAYYTGSRHNKYFPLLHIHLYLEYQSHRPMPFEKPSRWREKHQIQP